MSHLHKWVKISEEDGFKVRIDRLYPLRCFFTISSKCLANGDYSKCEMMLPLGKKYKGKDLFFVPDERPIYDEQECKFFLWLSTWHGYRHQSSWLLHDGEK